MMSNYLHFRVIVAPTRSEFLHICQKLDINQESVIHVTPANLKTGIAGFARRAIYPEKYSIPKARVSCQRCVSVGFLVNRYTYKQSTCPECKGRKRIEPEYENPQYTVKEIEGKWWVIDPEGNQHSSPEGNQHSSPESYGAAQSLAVVLSHEPQHHCTACNEYLALSEVVEHMFWLHGVSKADEKK